MSSANRLPVLSFPDPASEAVGRLLSSLGEDTRREGLQRTPERVAKALAFLTSGMKQNPKDVLNDAIFKEDYAGVVLVRDIEFYSLCEHHMLPFHGRAHVAYLPDGKVLGLSKLPRLIDVFARRLQVQERLTEQVADAVEQAIQPKGVAVLLDAEHFCMMMRGVSKQHARTTTSSFRGAFRESDALRREFAAAAQPARSSAVDAAPKRPPAGRERLGPGTQLLPSGDARAPRVRRSYKQGKLWARYQELTHQR